MTIKKFVLIIVALTALIFCGMYLSQPVVSPRVGAGSVINQAGGVHQPGTGGEGGVASDPPAAARALPGASGAAATIKLVPDQLAPNERRTKWGLVTLPAAPESSSSQ